jgi:hypothetical protein
MKAIHLKLRGLGRKGTQGIERALIALRGVVSVAAVGSIGLVSVLYDETVANTAQILRAARAIGFDASVYRPALGSGFGTA